MNDKILNKYLQLINDIDYAIRSAGDRWPNTNIVTRVITESLNIIKKTCGEQSDYYVRLKEITKDEKYHPLNANQYKGVIEAAYNDYKDGFANLDFFVRAEIFEDFLSMSEYLLSEGFYVPAASLAGGVLEDSLRKLCDKNNISYPQKTRINSLSTDLAKAGIYNALVAKEIVAKADIRNNADHGKINEFNKQDVENMVSWIREFIVKYLV